jgi:2,3-bisphosphoglycerate-independent phosphoglycerate mutase
MSVGLPEGQMGNSEVGHLNIGAGRIVYQDLTRIGKAIADGDFFENPVLLDCIARTKAAGGRLHLAGLLSDGGVHSHNTHLYALLELAKREGLRDVFVHCLLDGRDTPPKSGAAYLAQLEAKIAEIGAGRIAKVIGRYYAMDRDNRWERVQMAYRLLAEGHLLHTGIVVELLDDLFGVLAVAVPVLVRHRNNFFPLQARATPAASKRRVRFPTRPLSRSVIRAHSRALIA